MKLHHVAVFAASVSLIAFFSNVVQKDYMGFYIPKLPSEGEIAKLEVVKLVSGNTEGCLTKASQTKKIEISQIQTLRQLQKATPEEMRNLLGNPFCVLRDNTLRYSSELGKDVEIKWNKALDEPIIKYVSPPAPKASKSRRDPP